MEHFTRVVLFTDRDGRAIALETWRLWGSGGRQGHSMSLA